MTQNESDPIHPTDPTPTTESSKPAPFHPTDPAQAAALHACITFFAEMVMKYGEEIMGKKMKPGPSPPLVTSSDNADNSS